MTNDLLYSDADRYLRAHSFARFMKGTSDDLLEAMIELLSSHPDDFRYRPAKSKMDLLLAERLKRQLARLTAASARGGRDADKDAD